MACGVKCQRRDVCSYIQGPQSAPPLLLRGKILSRCNRQQMPAAKPELCSISREESEEEGAKDVCYSGTRGTIADYTLQNLQMLFSSVCYRGTFNKKVPTFVKKKV